MKKRPNKGQIFFKKVVKITRLKFRVFIKCLKFAQICPKQAKNGKTILFLTNSFKRGQIGPIWPLKSPNGNPASYSIWKH